MEQQALSMEGAESILVRALVQLIDLRMAKALQNAVMLNDNDSMSEYVEKKIEAMIADEDSALHVAMQTAAREEIDDFDFRTEIKDVLFNDITFEPTAR